MQEDEREEQTPEKKEVPTTSEQTKANDENTISLPLPEVKNKWILAFSVITFDLELGQSKCLNRTTIPLRSIVLKNTANFIFFCDHLTE